MSVSELSPESCHRPTALTALVEFVGGNSEIGGTYIKPSRIGASAAKRHKAQIVLHSRTYSATRSRKLHGILVDDGHIPTMLQMFALV